MKEGESMFRKKIVIGLVSLTFVGTAFWAVVDKQETFSVELGSADAKTNINNATTEENISDTKTEENSISKDIYGTFESEFEWAADPAVPENLMNDSTSMVHLKILSIGEGIMPPKSEDFSSPLPFTPYEVEVVDTISGNPLSGKMTVYGIGGDIKISKFVESTPENKNEKMGLTKLSKNEKESKFISFTTDHDYKLKTGKEYALLLSKQAEGVYTIKANGYGTFYKVKTKNGENIYKNVLTGKESNLKLKKNNKDQN
jgi:hypothetical protein